MSPILNFFSIAGEVAALMRSHDWSTSPLRDPAKWPQSLRTVVSLILNSKFPMFVAWGPELAFLYNDSYSEILGDRHPSALGRPLYAIWPEIRDEINPLIERALRGEASYYENLPLTLRRKGYDEETWFTFSYSPVLDEGGKVAGVFCACTETTHQVLAERERIEDSEQLRQLFQQAPGIMAVVRGPNHVFELVNDAYSQLIGYRDVIGKPVREALPEIEGQGLFELLDAVYQSGEPFVGRAVPVKLQRDPEGELEERFVDFIYQPIRDATGKITGIFAEGSDVTEVVVTHNALRESEQKLRQLANTIPQMAWMADPDGNVHWYNDRWYEYTGTTLEQMQGWGWKNLIEPKHLPVLIEKWQASLATGQPYELTVPMRGADGEFRTFFVRAAPLRDASGNIVQWFGTNTDVTQIEIAQKELKEANRRKDEFLAMLAHELRNPLAPISTAAQLLNLSVHDENRVRQASEIIARQVKHMTELVDDLLDVSRVTRGLVRLEKENLDLTSVINSAIEQVRPLIESRNHRLCATGINDQLFVHGDRTRLVQVISNLLSNAAKYTPQGGNITLSTEVGGGLVKIHVQDNGIGIDKSLLPHVFELFTQAARTPDRSQGGLGIGLALVRSIMTLHEGQVDAQSEGIGKGSTFTVTLPLVAQGSMEQERQPSIRSAPTMPVLRIMIVDDNLDAAQSLAALLEAKGNLVTVKEDAQSALSDAGENPPQVFILDIGLPDMDGYELARRLRRQPEIARAVFIALTGYGQAHDRVLSKSAGFDHHFVKPVDADQLTDILARAL